MPVVKLEDEVSEEGSREDGVPSGEQPAGAWRVHAAASGPADSVLLNLHPAVAGRGR